jgi:trans-aconitate methyltransferase
MLFDVTADAYGRFMGRYSEPLADQLVAMAGLRATDRVLDVGCGPGALTAWLVGVAGTGRVTAIDPSSSFVSAVAARLPGRGRPRHLARTATTVLGRRRGPIPRRPPDRPDA